MSNYFDEFQGRFIGIMQWDDCHALLQKLVEQPSDWYLYDTLKEVPKQTADANHFTDQISEIKKILTNEHQERYCGIVYTNDLEKPSLSREIFPLLGSKIRMTVFSPNSVG